MFLLYFIEKYLRTSLRTSEAKIARKIRTSRLSEKKDVLIRKKGVMKKSDHVCVKFDNMLVSE